TLKPQRSAPQLAAARSQHLHHQLKPVHLPPPFWKLSSKNAIYGVPGIWNDLHHPALHQQHILFLFFNTSKQAIIVKNKSQYYYYFSLVVIYLWRCFLSGVKFSMCCW
ncbi:unnamed protein product, partial [Heterosigma akashiwo]